MNKGMESHKTTKKAIERLKILSQVIEYKLTQINAAKILQISERHVRRLISEMKTQGNQAIISKKRNRFSNRCYSSELKTHTLCLIKDHYIDFGPKLANEYLKKEHNIFVLTETLRLWMIASHLWVSRSKKNKKLHPPRQRRSAFGELIQIDGSHHD